ncbi:Putative Fatty acid synthase subunit alpha [Aspergillus calidoustus]|uniref:Putative Fatty acid synthase subunit alpha n=1 Tax=Aspergillus calidoustus TaxID=454130 RepID=A0A0U5G5Z6_ASPCI|nr:Putative Fatty acid synthase subunit alpha [Aspergillus calidoustus]
MPAGFNQRAIQEYLESRWGLTEPHATIPLCFATTLEPARRLATPVEAHSYLDNLVKRYAAFHGISLIPVNDSSERRGAVAARMVEVANLDELNQKHKKLYRAQLNSLSEYLDVDLPASEQRAVESETRASDLEQTVRLLDAELGEQFIQGIAPIFNISQSRKYDCWWNWCREELIRLLIQISQDPSSACHPGMEDRIQRLLNRWHSSCADIVQAYLQGLRTSLAAPVTIIQPTFEEIISLGTQSLTLDPLFVYILPALRPRTTITNTGQLEYQETPRHIEYYPDAVRDLPNFDDHPTKGPFVHIKTRGRGKDWEYDPNATSLYHTMLDVGVAAGLTYANKAVLVTGAGPSSIAAEIIKGLLSGGASVVVTTSRPLSEAASFYQWMYRHYGARNSSLVVLPVNQASSQDCEALIQHIYGPDSPTGGDLDYIIPFAASPQTGEPEALGGRQELALRAMLVNVLRLIGFVRREKERRRVETRPTMVVLPMSCNEGTFGGDGLYSESKIGLKALFNRFHSESWSRYLTICGAVIGWTRGTTIMRSSNMVAEEVEKLGVMTFTQMEMAFNILALMTPALTVLAEDAPIYADLTGGLGSRWQIKEQIAGARKRISDKQKLAASIAEEDSRHEAMVNNPGPPVTEAPRVKTRRARLRLPFPHLRDMDASCPDLQGMIDLSRVPVIVGYSELGPWGNTRTRWEMEHQGEFSLEGYIEMAWIMGLIQHVDGQIKGEPYVGWVDADTQTPLRDDEVPAKYHDHIMAGSGLRLIKPTDKDSYDPSRKEFLHEVAVEGDLPPFEAPKSVAEAFKLRQGDFVRLTPISNSDNYRVHIRKGAILMIPKTIPFDQVVAGRIPDGWNPDKYGIPEDIVQQVDVTTLYALCCVSEAFLSAGIKDPYEIYQHIHVSELVNCLGSGGGPMNVIQSMYRDRFLDRQLKGDLILEHFVNSMGAWVNMLLLSATGPLKTPVGACATALESLDIGCEAIQTGKWKMAIVGGCDDYGEELAYEFASINATANSTKELARGRTPAEISRPTASSRSGFAESAGCGVQILMSAELAIEMGLPIYGVVAYTQMASDQIGRSIPAPGKGILTAARETRQAKISPLLDLNFRQEAFNEDFANISKRLQQSTVDTAVSAGTTGGHAANLRIRDAQRRWGNDIRLVEPSISPIRASLATWGLTVDDISVASMHGTSTKANEVNEGDVINTQMEHLGRRKGNPLLCVCQKSLTGHPKAGAGAWQLNGCLQMLQEGIVPGNRNADNIDRELRQFDHLVYPMESIKVSEVKATLLTSFGFGQKGALTITVSPKYLFASLSAIEYQSYCDKVTKRQRSAIPHFISRLIKNDIVRVKSQPPWNDAEAMRDFFLDPTSRVVDGKITHAARAAYTRPHHLSDSNPPIAVVVQDMVKSFNHPPAPTTAVGVDVEDIVNISIDDPAFIDRNFTLNEREYCFGAPDPRASFAGRWSAKEAVFKSLRTSSAGAAAAMSEIEILSFMGIPRVVLHGHAQEVAASTGITHIEVTISHCDRTAIAVALATRKHSAG